MVKVKGKRIKGTMAETLHPVEQLRRQYAKKIECLDKIFTNKALCKLIRANEDPEYEPPKASICRFLKDIDTYLVDADLAKYRRSLDHFLCHLDCFKMRVFDKNRKQHLWNPLDQSFDEFSKQVNGQLDYFYADTSYPPTEIIHQWLNDK